MNRNKKIAGSRRHTFPSLLAVILSATGFAEAASFQPLGDLPGGAVRSRASDISADGSTVVGWSESAAGTVAFRWRAADGMVDLGDLPGGSVNSSATGVSADGSVVIGVGTFQNSGGALTDREAIMWSEATRMIGLGDVAGGNFGSIAYGVSADGGVVVGQGLDASIPTINAALWSGGPGSATGLDGGEATQASFSVSADGTAVAGRMQSGAGFRWTALGGFVDLGGLPSGANSIYAYRISADGTTIVGAAYEGSVREAFRWRAGTGMQGLGDLAGGTFGSAGLDLSGDGSIVVGAANLLANSSDSDAFIWTQAGGMQRLQDLLVDGGATGLTGWRLREATGISDDGRFVAGWGVNAQGQGEAFIADLAPVPAPPGLGLFVTALGAVAVRFRRRKGRG